MPVHQSAGDVERGFRYDLSQKDRFQVPLESFQQFEDNRAGNFARSLAPPQCRAYFYLSQRQYR
jgi:hypothetical protein